MHRNFGILCHVEMSPQQTSLAGGYIAAPTKLVPLTVVMIVPFKISHAPRTIKNPVETQDAMVRRECCVRRSWSSTSEWLRNFPNFGGTTDQGYLQRCLLQFGEDVASLASRSLGCGDSEVKH